MALDAGTGLSVIGTIASLFGAFVSWKQARKSLRAAEEAEKVRGELVGRRHVSELVTLLTKCKSVERVMSKYGPAFQESGLAGVDFEDDGRQVQEFMSEITMHGSYFRYQRGNHSADLCNQLSPLLSDLVNAGDAGTRRRAGQQIWRLVSAFLRKVKDLVDRKRDTARGR